MVPCFAAGAVVGAVAVWPYYVVVFTATQIEVVASNAAATNDFANMSFTILW